jgi:hypothetical protein
VLSTPLVAKQLCRARQNIEQYEKSYARSRDRGDREKVGF